MGLFDGTPLERPVLCERCGKDVKDCECPPIQEDEIEHDVLPEKQRLMLRKEKRKRGKMVTVVTGLSGSQRQRKELLTDLKNTCGAGGSMDGEDIEIQGQHLERIRQFLQQQGYKVGNQP